MKPWIFAGALLMLPGTLPAAGIETTEQSNARNPAFASGKRALEAKDWQKAAEAFSKVVKRDPWNADAQNMLGYAYRNLGQLPQSLEHYNEALRLNPNHRGAHEYIGIAYLQSGQPEKAREHLAQLERICGTGCEEYRDLAAGIDSHRQ